MRIALIFLLLTLAACAEKPVQLANPASSNCAKKGGALVIEKNAAGGEFGVCHFADNRQCEEWALMRGDCPVGGVRIVGYYTNAARYCGITGGAYKMTARANGATVEQGTCRRPNGQKCDVHALFAGGC